MGSALCKIVVSKLFVCLQMIAFSFYLHFTKRPHFIKLVERLSAHICCTFLNKVVFN